MGHGRRRPPWAGLLLFAACVIGCADSREAPGSSSGTGKLAPPFIDRARATGLEFVHYNGMSGERYIVEAIGSGAALFDYDRDGDLDAYLVQGATIGTASGSHPASDRLFRNQLTETGQLRFVDVTESAGIELRGYGMGVAVGDIDGDGWPDLYVTHWGPDVLLRNNTDGTFSDVTATSGIRNHHWGTSATFLDYDADGQLDLFVANYVRFSLETHHTCYAAWTAVDYCGPDAYEPYPDRLYRNLGDGRFEDVTAASQIARHYGAGLGAVSADLNGDGWTDLYVANDGNPNQLWINQGDGTFRDDALLAGCALNRNGQTEASMGVDAADFDGDGDEDLFMTHLVDETNTLYLNDGRGMFDDATAEAGLGVPSRRFTGFGTAGLDVDNDGWLDLFVANGAVKAILAQERAGDPLPLRETNQLFLNRGGGRFEDVSADSGEEFARLEVSRGAAIGDVDNDGDDDILLVNNNDPARLLINQLGQHQHWIGLRVVEDDDGPAAIGARVEVLRPDGAPLVRRVRRNVSYCSASDPRVRVGLGDRDEVQVVRVAWPGGEIEQWTDLPIDRYTTLVRGSGQPVSP